MKKRLVVSLVGLAISFALPIFAQKTNTPDPKLRERLVACTKALTDAFEKNDAAAVAANFTENAALVTPYGRFWGGDIEQWFAELFKGIQSSNNLFTADEDSPHILGKAGNEIWATGKWSQTIKSPEGGSVQAGYWAMICEGDDWKIRMLCYNLTPPPAATPSPTASPSDQ